MTRDEVIALANECDMRMMWHESRTGKISVLTSGSQSIETLEKFAAAIEARVRESDPALRLVAEIRFAIGDEGKRMQDELVEYCRELRKDAERYRWLRDCGDEYDQLEIFDTSGNIDPEGLDAAIDCAHSDIEVSCIEMSRYRGQRRIYSMAALSLFDKEALSFPISLLVSKGLAEIRGDEIELLRYAARR